GARCHALVQRSEWHAELPRHLRRHANAAAASAGGGLTRHQRSVKAQPHAGRSLVAVGQDANVLLHVSTSRLGGTSSGTARGSERNYSELGGLAGGGMRPRLLSTPATGMVASRSAPAAQPLLVVRVDATAVKDARIAWVASMQCRVTGSDEGRVAQ